MSKIDDVEKLIREGKSCKECKELGYGESTYYRAKSKASTNEKKPEKPDSNNGEVGAKTEEAGSDVVPVVSGTGGGSSSVDSDNKEVEAVKPKAASKAASSKKKAVTKSKGNTKEVNSNSNSNLKEVKSSWKKKILIVVGLLSLAGLMSLFLKAKAPAQEVETVTPPTQNRRIPRPHQLKR